MIKYKMLLDLFDGEGGDGAAGPAAEGTAQNGSAQGVPAPVPEAQKKAGRRNPELANVRYGRNPDADTNAQQPQPAQQNEEPAQPEDLDAEFSELIKGKFKAQYGEAVKNAITSRLPEAKSNKDQLKKLEPLMDALALQHNIQRDDNGRLDWEKVAKAVLDSDEWIEKEAERRGLSIETTRYQMELERDRAEHEQEKAAQKEAEETRAEEERKYQRYLKIRAEADELKKTFPSFDLNTEVKNNPKFGYLVGDCGVDVATAYKAVHHDEIVRGSNQNAAQTAQEQMANSIAARGRRPVENGTGASAPGTVWKSDPKTFTKEDRREIRRRAAMGIKQYF